jgi:CRISPR/Cas system-associated exonuclease Cas4 (RecB family)
MENNDSLEDLDVKGIIDEYLTEEQRPKRIGSYYPSEIGMCIRRSYYSYFITKPTEPAALRIFALGNNVHEFIAKALKDSNELAVVEEEKPIKVEYKDDSTNFTIYGRIDDYIETKTGKKIIIEAKSTGDITKVTEPDPKHKMQITLYLGAQTADYGLLVYADKKNLEIKQFRVEYSENDYKKVMQRFKDLDYHLKNKILPPAEYYFDNKKVWECKYCPYYRECMQALADANSLENY